MSESPRNLPMLSASAFSRSEARLTGVPPHEFLLRIASGAPIDQHYVVDLIDSEGTIVGQEIRTKTIFPDIDMRIDAAKAAAPYYAPRLATRVITIRSQEDELNDLSDEQLEKAIQQLEGKSRGSK